MTVGTAILGLKLGNVANHRLTGRQIWAGTVRTQLEASKGPSLQAWFSTKPAGKSPLTK
ncbi:hypothetical protein [Levilactobacillus sp. N40-8-2]|uniref:hypothetical protein n=1 Tax=Levilactobacillus muriae TaxID=3238987 RepID=UPI0038B2AD5E